MTNDKDRRVEALYEKEAAMDRLTQAQCDAEDQKAKSDSSKTT